MALASRAAPCALCSSSGSKHVAAFSSSRGAMQRLSVTRCEAAASSPCSTSSTSSSSSSSSPCRPAEALLQPRRAALAAGMLMLLAPAVAPAPSRAAICADLDTAEEGDDCRRQLLDKDATKQATYADATSNRASRTAGGVPVSVLDDEYSAATLALAADIETYFGLDVYDKGRPKFIAALKASGLNWVSKYARGGSVRKQSARALYNAVDAVVGHLASNGLAPFPVAKAKAVRANLDTARNFLAEGR